MRCIPAAGTARFPSICISDSFPIHRTLAINKWRIGSTGINTKQESFGERFLAQKNILRYSRRFFICAYKALLPAAP
ncbi:hypothetical protein F6Q07_16265 [Pectobacterium parmentieri]|nr:hypothetical protein C5E26_10840 [Pectobacterium parmentieri]AYH05654.1 hypothetical protein C5E25_10015 [Pectobacterium parmentieri]AYH14475.1 hypothetical protein C5E23_09985 [Pectobacterium parmentieri]AYH23177.1 hypothetical protein C5E21_09990 [Pectobacterium parmentieri]AYH27659.1 hypothetical protein C5E20_11245 [Pectobacterium parmentieri]